MLSRRPRTPSGIKLAVASALLLTLIALFFAFRSDPQASPSAASLRADSVDSAARIASAFAPAVVQASFRGTVRAQTGVAIADAQVCAACATCSLAELPPAACTRSAADGTYALAAAGMRSVVISAVAAGFATGHANRGLPLALLSTVQSEIDITLEPGGARLSGTVIDALGGPIARARVVFERLDGPLRGLQETLSDDEGHFTLPTTAGLITVRAELEGYAASIRKVIAPASDIELQLIPASTVRGTVVSAATNDPVAGVEVRALPEGFPALTEAAVSDSDGTFSLAGLEPGRYALSASHAHWRGITQQLLEVRLTDVVQDVVIPVIPAVQVLGHVEQREKSGLGPCQQGLVVLEPLPGAEAARSVGKGLSSPVDADGLVRFEGVAQGLYEASVHCTGQLLAEGPRQLVVADRDLEVHWQVQEGVGLIINVQDGVGQPVPFAPLLLATTHAEHPDVQAITSLQADARGRASVVGELQPGRYTVQPTDGLSGEPLTVDLREGSGTREVTLRLAGSGTIVVTAHDGQGAGVSGLQVSARAEGGPARTPGESSQPPNDGRGFVSASEQGDGRYLIGPLEPGQYAVELEDGSNPVLRVADGASVRVTQGQTTSLQVLVSRAGKVRGTVVDERGAPEPDTWVSASPEGAEPSPALRMLAMFSPPHRVLTDAEGNFELTQLRTGARYTLKAKQPYDNAVVMRGVSEGQTVRIVLTSAGSVCGVLYDAGGRPVGHGVVSAQHAETNTMRTASTKRDGSFVLERVPTGQVVISAGDEALGFAQQTLNLQAGQRMAGVQLTFVPHPQAALPSAEAPPTEPSAPPAMPATPAVQGG